MTQSNLPPGAQYTPEGAITFPTRNQSRKRKETQQLLDRVSQLESLVEQLSSKLKEVTEEIEE